MALYKPCKPKPKPSTYDPPDNHLLAEIQRPILRPEPKQQICHQHAVVVVVTLFPTKIHENTHMYNTLTVVSPQNVRMYFVSGCQKKLRLIELAAATCYLQFCRATARTGPDGMTHWHPGGRFKESFSSNGFHNIYSIILSRIISRYVPFHQMSF